jgi:hypothetical protein
MKVNGQLHAPTSLTPGKYPPVTILEEAELAVQPVWVLQRPLSRIEPWLLNRPARSLVGIPT